MQLADAPSDRRPLRRGSARAAILGAAARLFAERGFTHATVRDIAAAAGADPALVKYHFGSKEALFLEVVQQHNEWRDLVETPLEELAVAVVTALLDADAAGRGRPVFAALVRASDSPSVRSRLAQSMEEQFVRPIAARLEGADAELRARLFAAQVHGLMTVLWLIDDQALLRDDRAAIVSRYAAALDVVLRADD